MGKMICELCGGDDFIKENGAFKCTSCGVKYSLEEARGLMKDDSQPSTEPCTKEPVQADEKTEPEKQPEEKSPFDIFYEEFSAAENLKGYTSKELLQKLSEEVIGLINEIFKADRNKTRVEFEDSALHKASCYVREFWSEGRTKEDGFNSLMWEYNYYLGLAKVIEKYDDPEADKNKHSSFYYFYNAMLGADREIVKTRILPFIDNIRKHYVERYEAGLVLKTDEEEYKKELYRYLKLYNEWEDLSYIAKDYVEELRETAKPYSEEIIQILLKDKVEVVKQMNQYKERYLSIIFETNDVYRSMSELREVSKSHFFGITKEEIEREKQLKKQVEDLKAADSEIYNKAYVYYKENCPQPKEEREWKHQFHSWTHTRARWIEQYSHEKNPVKEKVLEQYDKLDEDLKGYGFELEDYLEPYPEDYYERSDLWDSPVAESICEASLSKTIYFYDNTQTDAVPVYTMKENKLYAGNQVDSSPVFTIKGSFIYKGDQLYGTPVLSISKDKIYEGYGFDVDNPVFSLEKDGVYEGTKTYLSPKLTIKIN